MSKVFSIKRWAVTSGTERTSRASLALEGGGHTWRASAVGNGAVDALMRAADRALQSVLEPGIELESYQVHASGHGHDASAVVNVQIQYLADSLNGWYRGEGVHANVLEASLLAYIDAISTLVSERGIDVAAAAPAPGHTDLPVRDDDTDARRRHGDHMTSLYNR